MNLWRMLQGSHAGGVSPATPGSADENRRATFMPRLDVALEVSAAVARVVLDPRLTFAAAVAVALLVPGRRGDVATGVLVALGSLLVYRAQQLRRIPDHLRLLAWADLNKPLLRRLSLEAPGTYAHTMATANLVEAACSAIGADALLGRVGTYYHDIGKLRKPQHFVENQHGRNPHDKLKPATSAAIIKSHVRDGLELAREHGVPPEIRAFIAEHHGTLPIAYFLEKARERDGTVQQGDYTYGGPTPRTAETAILMLADGVEARVRSLADPTPEAIREAVTELIRRRMAEGQLDAAPLTLRQLAIVREQFIRTLTAMHHDRIEYPTATGQTLSLAPGSRASA